MPTNEGRRSPEPSSAADCFMENREKKLSGSVAYRGKILDLRIDKVGLPNGRKAVREVVEHAPAVAMLPLSSSGQILLIRQFRYAVGREMLEIPAGLVEQGEPFEAAARRELQEEIGFYPDTLTEIGRMYNSPGFSTELLVLYLAEGLCPSRLQPDDDENIQVHPVALEEIAPLLRRGDIVDGKTFTALSWFLAFRRPS